MTNCARTGGGRRSERCYVAPVRVHECGDGGRIALFGVTLPGVCGLDPLVMRAATRAHPAALAAAAVHSDSASPDTSQAYFLDLIHQIDTQVGDDPRSS